MNMLGELGERFESQTFEEKILFFKGFKNMPWFDRAHLAASSLSYDGYLKVNREYAVTADEGEHYVYIWKHAWGEPFYIGQGKGDRMSTKFGRADAFYEHIDKGDAVVYLVLDKVDEKTSRIYENYISASLSRTGYGLANKDNRTLRGVDLCGSKEKLALTKAVEDSVLSILLDYPRECDYRVTEEFIKEYGCEHFSSQFCKQRKRSAKLA